MDTNTLLIILVVARVWRRHYWGHALVDRFSEEIGGPNPILRLPTLLEGLAVGFLLIALLGPVYPFVMNRIERGGLQIMFVFDLSQSMEEPLQRPQFTATAAQAKNGKIEAGISAKDTSCLLYQLATGQLPGYLNGVITPTVEALSFVATKLGPEFANLGCPIPLT